MALRIMSISVQNFLKRIIPYSVVVLVRKLIYFGWYRKCSECGSWVRTFLPQGYGYPVLDRLRVVGGLYKRDDRCPICHASDRERLVLFYLKNFFEDMDSKKSAKILHMAPEKSISSYLRSRSEVIYTPADLTPGRYRNLKEVAEVNLLNTPFEKDSFDIIICNHVLEHIPDDLKAMREIRRILAAGGCAILQVPLTLRLAHTIEGGELLSGAERIENFGQNDHVRLYAPADYVLRLEQAGFTVSTFDAFEEDQDKAKFLDLNPFEVLYVCTKK